MPVREVHKSWAASLVGSCSSFRIELALLFSTRIPPSAGPLNFRGENTDQDQVTSIKRYGVKAFLMIARTARRVENAQTGGQGPPLLSPPLRLEQRLLVKEVLAQAGADAAQIGDTVGELLDRLHLLRQVVRLEVVGKLRVVVLRGNGVQVQQRLVDRLLQLQSGLHRLQAAGPALLDRLGNVLEDDATTAQVLVLHQLLRVLALLFAGGGEELLKAGQGDVVAVEVERLVVCWKREK